MRRMLVLLALLVPVVGWALPPSEEGNGARLAVDVQAKQARFRQMSPFWFPGA